MATVSEQFVNKKPARGFVPRAGIFLIAYIPKDASDQRRRVKRIAAPSSRRLVAIGE